MLCFVQQRLSSCNLGKYQEAIEWYDKALKIDPNYVISLNNKGYALFQIEQIR